MQLIFLPLPFPKPFHIPPPCALLKWGRGVVCVHTPSSTDAAASRKMRPSTLRQTIVAWAHRLSSTAASARADERLPWPRDFAAQSPERTESAATPVASRLPALTYEQNHVLRARHLAPSLKTHYAGSPGGPLKLASGRGTYLMDVQGNRYLDCVNNVCHVGHCHPRVVRAASAQLATLNTNSRYLHDNIVHLAQRLTALMPRPLEVAIFVNSGTEANDLALRLARNHTGMRDVFCVDGAYHGNSAATLAISP